MNFANFSFSIWGQVGFTPATGYLSDEKVGIFMTVYHSETMGEGEDRTWRVTTSKLRAASVFFRRIKTTHVGGTLVERLAAGDKVRITQLGQNGFVYSGDGGGALTFRGELIALSVFQ